MKGRIFAAAGLLALAACGSTAVSSSPSVTQDTTCWYIGAGIVIKTVSSLSGCSAPYAYGDPTYQGIPTASMVAGFGSPACDYSFPQTSWEVWDTDGGTSGNAEAFCNTLSEDQS